MSSDIQRLEQLLAGAAALASPAERAAYLDRVCGADDTLRAEIERLLEAGEQARDFLEQSVLPLDALSTDELCGARVGRYKLLEQIGDGSFGVVYMAEQLEPVQRKVALKIIKAGMDTKEVIARFEAERQALALMDHPNIAHIYDAGVTAPSDSQLSTLNSQLHFGRPYFVMELVRGIPLTEYCDRNTLPTAERLQLFIKVCQAVQHAHQKGVIHRDLKPSNILVTEIDGAAVPKIIDFGVAKALGQKLTQKTLFTAFHQMIGTPAYMSPEQAKLSGVDVDTRSDIYSLGVLLYELLTGVTPFDPETLHKAALDEVRRVIRETDPPKPSTRLRTLGDKLTDVARQRQVDPAALARSVHGDLDWIVMKCLEKDRQRRYEAVSDLARDIDSHLSHKPVSAAAPTLGYRAAKYVRRHRRRLAIAAAFVVLVVLASMLSVWQARRAERERASSRNTRWALETALPEIERSLEKDDYATAFKLVQLAQPFVRDNTRFKALSARAVGDVSIETTPPGAHVFIRDYGDVSPAWETMGKSPLYHLKVSQGFNRWKVTLPGYETREGALLPGSQPAELKVTLDKNGTIPPGMVRIEGATKFRPDLNDLDSQHIPELVLPDFLLDRYEVSNQRYQEFVAAGGYQKPQFWKHKFIKNGVELSWEAAMKLFVDQTGRPGPATWKNGDFPPGQEDYPVSGVSWYEAAAYAEFAGKRLPTVYHWRLAAVGTSTKAIIPLSNFGGQGPAPVGTFQGITCRGVYDMAGNVREWCFNEVADGHRVTTGGAWGEPAYMFYYADKSSPLLRTLSSGFRCMQLLADDGTWNQAAQLVPWKAFPDLGDLTPCSDEVFQAYLMLYHYNRSAKLQPEVETMRDLSEFTRLEKVSFNTAYGNERMTAYLYFPRAGKPPLQTVIWWPGADAWDLTSLKDHKYVTGLADSFTRNGRAFVLPVLQGMYERERDTHGLDPTIMRVKDFARTIDYLESRQAEFDTSKLAYLGESYGAILGGVVPAIDTRIKVAVLADGGLSLENQRLYPQGSQVNFAPRIKIPILLQGCIEDSILPVEAAQKPLMGLFGTSEQDKRHTLYQVSHGGALRLNAACTERLKFLDKYLGPASLEPGELSAILERMEKTLSTQQKARGPANPQTLLTMNNLAWFLATCPNANARNGQRALLLAAEAVTATSRTNAIYLDTLAAAHGELRQFAEAVRMQQEAIAMLQTAADSEDYASRLKLYQAGTPYREP